MTINEHDRVTTGRTGGSATTSLDGAHALVDLLNAGEPYAVAFGGQGGNWLENLEELISSAGIESELSEVVGEAAAAAASPSPASSSSSGRSASSRCSGCARWPPTSRCRRPSS